MKMKQVARSSQGRNNNLMLPDHFHDVTYDHIWPKILQELPKTPARNTKNILEEQATSNAELSTSVTRV